MPDRNPPPVPLSYNSITFKGSGWSVVILPADDHVDIRFDAGSVDVFVGLDRVKTMRIVRLGHSQSDTVEFVESFGAGTPIRVWLLALQPNLSLLGSFRSDS